MSYFTCSAFVNKNISRFKSCALSLSFPLSVILSDVKLIPFGDITSITSFSIYRPKYSPLKEIHAIFKDSFQPDILIFVLPMINQKKLLDTWQNTYPKLSKMTTIEKGELITVAETLSKPQVTQLVKTLRIMI